MTLPNYFLADLPPEATLSGVMITEACRTLKQNREKYLAMRSTQSLVEILCGLGQQWLRPAYSFRKLVLEQGPSATGFSRTTLGNGLDAFFKQFTPESFQGLLVQDLGHARRLDQIVSDGAGPTSARGAMAHGPELLVQIAAGNIPNPTLIGIVLGVLVRSAQFIKCASPTGAAFLPRIFAHSLYDAEPKLGACLEIAGWRGGRTDLEESLFSEADCVTATGNDESLAAIQRRLPHRVRFVGYGERVSFGYVASQLLSGIKAQDVVVRAAADVTAWDQLGCLSPHLIYVENGGGVGAERFAEMLSEELSRREEVEPRGAIPAEAAAAIASRRAIYEVRAAHSPETRFWQSKNSTAWTVVYEADPRFQLSCLNRFVYVKGVKDLTEALQNAESVRGKVSTVGVAAPEERAPELTVQLARWGVTRVCPLGRMQSPPLTWRHDGRPALADLVIWTDWEQG